MVRAGSIREEYKQTIQKRQQSQESSQKYQQTFFQRRAEMSTKEITEKQRSIYQMEHKEAELIDNIRQTQKIQVEEFEKLEQLMY